MSSEDGLPPGWYPHAQAPNALRYWDGAQWTESYAPLPPQQTPRQWVPEWLTTVGFIAMIVFPIAGLVVGLIHLAKDENTTGGIMVVGSLIAGAFWFSALSGAATY